MTKRSPVVAAIPNYNMAENLRSLLPQVLVQRYDKVFVLDDASKDHSVDVVREFGDDVTLVRQSQNGGPGANRNQIIGQVDDDVIIHFIDADMDLMTPESPVVAREVFARYANQGVGMIGGLVRKVDGMQEPHNYGPVFSLWSGFTSGFPWMVYALRGKPRLADAVQRLTGPITKTWPNLLAPPTPAPAYWVHEGNMLVDSTLFGSIGGYDTKLRSHEIQDLAIRLEKRGVKRQFDPSIEVVHHDIDVRGFKRSGWAVDAARYLIRKHGLLRYVTDV